jgi:hypothetical protein
MLKNAAVQDPEMNRRKEETDHRAGELLHVDLDKMKADAEELAAHIRGRAGGVYKVVVSGGAGSGKTSISFRLAEALGAKHLDMDKYVPGGFTEHEVEYARRLNKALYEMWEDIPTKGGWVIDHVEACSKEVVGLLNPTFAILCDPGVERIRSVAEARTQAGSDHEERLSRGLQSAIKSTKQYAALKGTHLPSGVPDYHLKLLDEG